MYREKEVTLNELKSVTSEEFGQAVVNYFKLHPKKTVFKVNKTHRVRKHDRKVNVFYLYMR